MSEEKAKHPVEKVKEMFPSFKWDSEGMTVYVDLEGLGNWPIEFWGVNEELGQFRPCNHWREGEVDYYYATAYLEKEFFNAKSDDPLEAVLEVKEKLHDRIRPFYTTEYTPCVKNKGEFHTYYLETLGRVMSTRWQLNREFPELKFEIQDLSSLETYTTRFFNADEQVEHPAEYLGQNGALYWQPQGSYESLLGPHDGIEYTIRVHFKKFGFEVQGFSKYEGANDLAVADRLRGSDVRALVKKMAEWIKIEPKV